jgi:hypothetical protein
VDNTPEFPDHIPPSEEVLHAEEMAEHVARVRREKRKFYATWLGLGLVAYAAIFVLFLVEQYYLVYLAGVVYVLMLVWSNLRTMDSAYRDGFRIGAALASLNVIESYSHAMEHIVHGQRPCEDSVKIKRVITPHVWEDHIVREQIREMVSSAKENGAQPGDSFFRDIS